jgi:ligand-binding sensor domain-containing protein
MSKIITQFPAIIFFMFLISCEQDADIIDPDEVGIWKYFNTSNGLTNNDIRAIKQDASGTVWIGTYGGGVCTWDNGNWSSLQQNDGLLDNRIYSIEEDVFGDIWIGTAGGLSIFSDGSLTNYPTISGGYYLPISLYSDSRGWMWIGTTSGIYIFDYSDVYPISFQNEDLNTIWAITEDNKGQVWFSTQGGALFFNEDDGFDLLTVNEGLYSNNVRYIFQDSWGKLWFAHLETERITRWDGTVFEYINLLNGYSFANVLSIVEDLNRNIWFTSKNSGVTCFDGVIPRTIGIYSGLKDTDIRCSAVENTGNLWFGSKNQGIQVYIPE